MEREPREARKGSISERNTTVEHPPHARSACVRRGKAANSITEHTGPGDSGEIQQHGRCSTGCDRRATDVRRQGDQCLERKEEGKTPANLVFDDDLPGKSSRDFLA